MDEMLDLVGASFYFVIKRQFHISLLQVGQPLLGTAPLSQRKVDEVIRELARSVEIRPDCLEFRSCGTRLVWKPLPERPLFPTTGTDVNCDELRELTYNQEFQTFSDTNGCAKCALIRRH